MLQQFLGQSWHLLHFLLWDLRARVLMHLLFLLMFQILSGNREIIIMKLPQWWFLFITTSNTSEDKFYIFNIGRHFIMFSLPRRVTHMLKISLMTLSLLSISLFGGKYYSHEWTSLSSPYECFVWNLFSVYARNFLVFYTTVLCLQKLNSFVKIII